ncbi:hypothetical protein BS17DRAFT_783637 [Gyrodon lividus]|nr:hypothetical protein BS17DRAFT_783637 [Gyrodon lividus]
MDVDDCNDAPDTSRKAQLHGSNNMIDQGIVFSGPHSSTASSSSPLTIPSILDVEVLFLPRNWSLEEILAGPEVVYDANDIVVPSSYSADLNDFFDNFFSNHERTVLQSLDFHAVSPNIHSVMIPHLSEPSCESDVASYFHPSDPNPFSVSSNSELSAALDINLTSHPARQGPFVPGLLPKGGAIIANVMPAIPSVSAHASTTCAPPTTSTNESSSHNQTVNQDLEYDDYVTGDLTLSANWHGSHGPGPLQLVPIHTTTNVSPAGQAGVPRNSRTICAMRYAPYPTYNPLPQPNMRAVLPGQLSETPHECGWREEDGSICGKSISRTTVPQHLTVHQITDMASNVPIICRWCRDGRKPIKRESIVRHMREVHLHVRRATT